MPIFEVITAPTKEYVQWLEERLKAARKRSNDLNDRYHREQNERYRNQQDYLDYEDDRRD